MINNIVANSPSVPFTWLFICVVMVSDFFMSHIVFC